MANKLTQAQERKLERQKQEIDNRKEIVKGLALIKSCGIADSISKVVIFSLISLSIL